MFANYLILLVGAAGFETGDPLVPNEVLYRTPAQVQCAGLGVRTRTVQAHLAARTN